VPAVLVGVLLVVPLLELYVLIQVGQVIGAPITIALLVLMSLAGAALLRREGARTWRSFRQASGAGRVPAKEVADGALVLFGGALLLTPGFLTDVLGLLCILPPTRAVLRRSLTGLVARRLLGPAAFLAPGRRRSRGSARIVDGEVLDPRDEP
jgi:UPF0716 protein FxsA